MAPLVLIVDPDSGFAQRLGKVAQRSGWNVVERTTFARARHDLDVRRPGAVVTNIKLGMFNGVHLAYLAKQTLPAARAIVYGDVADPITAVEAQRANAFYERRDSLACSLPSYLRSELPPADRRSTWEIDRRGLFRGGRRATDQAVLQAGRRHRRAPVAPELADQ
jgi:hypothetical protein